MFLALQQTINSQTSSIFYAEINNLIQSENATKSSIRVILKLVYNYKNSFTRLTGITLTIQDNTRELQLDKTRNQFMSNVYTNYVLLYLILNRLSKPPKSISIL